MKITKTIMFCLNEKYQRKSNDRKITASTCTLHYQNAQTPNSYSDHSNIITINVMIVSEIMTVIVTKNIDKSPTRNHDMN